MLRKVLALVVLLSLAANVAWGEALSVYGPDLASYRMLNPGIGQNDGLAGTWSGTAFTMNWSIAEAAGHYDYSYWFTGTGTATLGTWYLAVSPDLQAAVGTENNTQFSIVQNVSVHGGQLAKAIAFTGVGDDGNYSFYANVNPIWGSVYVTGSSGSSNYSVWNKGSPGYPNTNNYPFGNWVPTVDSTYASGGTVVPEPSLTALALIGLVGGALGRRASRKKSAE